MATESVPPNHATTLTPSDLIQSAGIKGARKSRKVLIKSRNRIFGRVKTKEEIMSVIAGLALKGMAMKEICAQTGKGKATVWRYLKMAEEKGLLKKSETGRVQITEEVEQAKQWAALAMDDFVQKYDAVSVWVNDMRTRKNGKPLKNWKSQLSHLKTVCDTLELTPYALISASDMNARIEACKKAMTEFAIAAQEGRVKYASKNGRSSKQMSEAGLKAYTMAVRNFAAAHGVAFPRGIAGVMSGKKVGYGKYAHVKLSFEKIDQCVQYLGRKYGHASLEQSAFIFYYLSCARNQAGAGVSVGHFVRHENGWITCEVFESKTETPWTKYLPGDNPHQKIFIDYLNKRSGCHYLFIDDESQAKRFGKDLSNTFKEMYKELGITEPYFYIHPVHALRHVGAHYWLNRPEVNYNHSIVATIGGWKYVGTLIDCYGKMPPEFIMKTLTGGRGLGGGTAMQVQASAPAA
ncbi:MAG: hypothetical protein AB1753_08430 [Thermoproteota archaeon]